METPFTHAGPTCAAANAGTEKQVARQRVRIVLHT